MSRVMKAVPFVVLSILIIAIPSVWANWVPDGVALCTATGNQERPQITLDGTGGAIITWEDARSGSYHDIYAQRVNASGAVQWAANGVALCTATDNQYGPAITSDGAGGAIVTWSDYRGDTYDIYAQRVNASGVVQWTADGVALCTAASWQQGPQTVSDGAGGAIVTWYDQRSGNADIYAQRVNASGAVQWAANGVALCTAKLTQMDQTITSDGAGGAIVTWEDSRNGRDHDIYAQRVNASGAVQWAANGVALCTLPENQEWPQITSDGGGGAIVTWVDLRLSTFYHIYAQRVDASGVVQWTADGVALCTTASYGQWACKIISDGVGGAIVTWQDGRSGYNNIYAQRVNSSGAVQWTADGVALAGATCHQTEPTIASDGISGAIVTWDDTRSGNYDIYAQRVNSSGAVQWTAGGVVLCRATGDQQHPMIACEGSSDAIVTWEDYRSGATNGNVYCYGFPQPLTAADAPAVPVELHQNYPNPFNPATTMTYSISERSNVTLKIYDVSGACIACLVDGQQEKGSYAVQWMGKDEKGNPVTSGIYLYRLTAGNQTISKKMVLLR